MDEVEYLIIGATDTTREGKCMEPSGKSFGRVDSDIRGECRKEE